MKWDGPDSVRSWMMAVAICSIYTIFFGIPRLTPFFFVESITRYQVSRAAASFPYNFVVFVYSFSGPLVGWIASKLGQRLTVCLGCFLASLGVGICFLAESIYVVFAMWGIIFGLGNAFCVNLLPLFIIQYFDKQRGRASGISGLGMSIGTFILSAIYEILMESYGLSGTFLILSGFLLNTIPVAMLLRKPDFIIGMTNPLSENITKESQQLNSIREQFFFEDKSCSVTEDHSLVKTTVKKESSRIECILPPKSETFLITECQVFNPQVPSLKNMDCVSEKRRKSKKFQSFKVLLDPAFILISVTLTEHLFLFMCFGTILVDFAKDIGIHEADLIYIPIANAIGDVIGRLCFGWVADRAFISNAGLSALAFLCQGVLQLSICWSKNVYMYLGIVMFTAFFNSVLFILKPLMVDEFFKPEEQIMVMPNIGFLGAPLTLCVSPMIGYFRGNLGSYAYMVYSISAMQFLGGLLWLITPYFITNRRNQDKDPCPY